MGKGKIEGWRIRSHRGSKTADHDCSKSPLVRLLGKETLEARWRPPWSQSPESILTFKAATALLQVSEGRLHICLSGLQTSFLSYSPCKCLFIYMEMLNIWENGIKVRDDCWPAALVCH